MNMFKALYVINRIQSHKGFIFGLISEMLPAKIPDSI